MAALQRTRHGLLVDQGVAGKVEEDHAVLGLRDLVAADHATGAVVGGHVDGDVVGVLEDVGQTAHVMHVVVEAEGRHGGEVRVETEHVHAQAPAGVGDHGADGAEADDAQGLAGDLGAAELVLGLLGGFAHVLVLGVAGDPLGAADDVARGQQHACHDQLLDGIGVGAGGVEDHDALLGAALQRDVVDAGAGAGDGQEALGELDLVHVGAAHDGCVCGVELLGGREALVQPVEACGGDVVHAVHGVHTKGPYLVKTIARGRYPADCTLGHREGCGDWGEPTKAAGTCPMPRKRPERLLDCLPGRGIAFALRVRGAYLRMARTR